MRISGKSHFIQNNSLKRFISQYYSILDHLGEDYLMDLRLANDIQDSVRSVVNLNYPTTLLDSIQAVRASTPFNEWFTSTEYNKMLDYKYDLMTNDINEVFIIINQLEQLKRSIGHRLEEYPRAISMAEQIIVMLEKTYKTDND